MERAWVKVGDQRRKNFFQEHNEQKGGIMLKRICWSLFLLAALGAGLVFLVNESQAMPNFARKYSADCTMCHTAVPKLNRIGYDFRAAGTVYLPKSARRRSLLIWGIFLQVGSSTSTTGSIT